MTDIERIKEIEKVFGFSLNLVSKDNLFEENAFASQYGTGFRNFSLDENGFVIGLALDCFPTHLLPGNFLSAFSKIKKLSLKVNNLRDYSFLTELKSLTSLDLSFNQITDYSFLTELKSLTSLDLSTNQITDASNKTYKCNQGFRSGRVASRPIYTSQTFNSHHRLK